MSKHGCVKHGWFEWHCNGENATGIEHSREYTDELVLYDSRYAELVAWAEKLRDVKWQQPKL
jgi:hypothetical protein